MGELQAAIGKTLRWGWQSYNPELPVNEREANRDWFLREIADVREALDNLESEINQKNVAGGATFDGRQPAR